MSDKNRNSSIIIALNDKPTLTVIVYHLERYGFIVNNAQTTDSLLELSKYVEPCIIIIDKDIPGSLTWQDLCAAIKSKKSEQDIKIILCSDDAQESTSNIDTLLLKPFIPSELVSKIKQFVNMDLNVTQKKILSFQDIEMNLSVFRVTRAGVTVHLGPSEFRILQCFLELPGKTLSREYIMNHVWGSNKVESRTIDVHINRLRSALKRKEDRVPIIKTIRSSGYALNFAQISEEV